MTIFNINNTFFIFGSSFIIYGKTLIVGRYIEKLGDVLDGKTYIVITKDNGIIYKRLNKNGKNSLMLNSDNTFYEPYEVKASDILEIWEYECNIGRTDRKSDFSTDKLTSLIMEMRQELREVKAKLST